MAQKNVMQLMDCLNLDKIRILNLFDLRDGNLQSAKEKQSKNSIEDSLFSLTRREELNQLFEDDAPCIISWGVDESLYLYKKQAWDYLQDKIKVGIATNTDKLSFRYIKPRGKQNQKKVICKLVELFIKQEIEIV